MSMKQLYDNVIDIRDYQHTFWNDIKRGFWLGFNDKCDIKLKDMMKFLVSKDCQIILNKDNCVGCSLCAHVCPKEAIKMCC